MILWELVAREVPFSNYPFQYQVEDAINKGIRPSIPDNCWDDFSILIKQCWAQQPADRPPFDQIITDLLKIIRFQFPNNNFQFYKFDGPLPSPDSVLNSLISPRNNLPSSKAASSPNLHSVVSFFSFLF